MINTLKRQLTVANVWPTSGIHPSFIWHNLSTGNPTLFPGLCTTCKQHPT